MFKTEIGNGLIDRPLNESSAAEVGVYVGALTDADMQQYSTEAFAPSSPTEFFLWVAEVKNHARTLGHHTVTILHYTTPTPNGKPRTIAEYARFRGGVEWQNAGIVKEAESLRKNYD